MSSTHRLRCQECREYPGENDSGQSAIPSALGWLRIHDKKPSTRTLEAPITFDGATITDNFYAEYISYERVGHLIAADRQQTSRTSEREILWPPGMDDLRGILLSRGLRDKCRRGHHIDVLRPDLKNLLDRYQDRDEIYI